MRRFLGLFALAALIAASATPVAAADPSGLTKSDTTITRTGVIHGNKSLSGRIAQSDADLLARNDGAIVGVMVKLDVDAAATYRGGVNGLAPTSPSVTGKSLRENGAAVAAYKRYVAGAAAIVKRAVQAAVPGAKLGRDFTIAFGGFAARIPANQARNLLKIQGVAAVQYDSLEKITTDATPDFIGASQLWPSIGGSQRAGEGVKIGTLDTGIWPQHPSFTDPGISHPGGTYGCEFGLSGEPNDTAFACNDKLIGAYAFLDTNLLVTGPGLPGEYCPSVANCSARDADGHGTHTSSTSGGRGLSSAVLFGVNRGPLSGIAPGAHVIMYRVCDADGCFQSDSVAAVEQAITDDVDVINFSISGGADPYSDAVELAFLDAYAAGILANASAGNDGPDAATANHGGPWTNTVGASTSDRHFITTLHLTANGGAALDIQGVTITPGISSPTPVVLASAAPYSNELCDAPAAPGTFTGEIVVCKRGVVGRAEKGYNVDQGDAAGMILYNASAGQTDLETDNHWLPAVHVQFESDAVKNFVTGNTNVRATWSTGVATAVTGDVMASFSSRGPLGDFIKPDVTAPGVQILAGHSPQHLDDPALGPDGQRFQAIAGTSMSSPHAAGVAALLKDSHPGWTPGQIKSAMMTQSVQSVLKEDGVTPADPFDRGAGSIRANRANKPGVTFDVTSADYYASAGNESDRINLNLPSVNAPNMPGVITTWRTARNATPVSQTYDISATGPAGATITINPSTITLNAWAEKSFFITINGTKLTDGQYFGQITVNPRSAGLANAVLPVAFDKQPGEVTLINSCEAGTVAVGNALDCEVTVQNLAPEPANVSLRVKGPRSRNLLLRNWDAGNKKGNGFVWNGQLSESIAPSIISLTPGHGPGGGFLSLTLFDVPGEGFYGDETLANYATPAFSFGHELYDTIGVTSNGYVVVGGGTSEDLNYIPQDFPNAAPPNNVLAPYWTDLNPGSAGDLYLAVLTDGTDSWIVIEWNGTPVYPGPANPRTFQIWLQIGTTTDEGIWFEHAANAVGAAGSSDGLIVGAENRDGTSGADLGWNVPPANTGYEVITGSPTPGGSKTIHYKARGVQTGTYYILATMVSDITQGTATDRDKVKVTP